MRCSFWKPEWNVPVLPKIYSGKSWAERVTKARAARETAESSQCWHCCRSWELTQKGNHLPRCAVGTSSPGLCSIACRCCAESQTPALGQAKGKGLGPGGTGNRNLSPDTLLWARGELLCDCSCRLAGTVRSAATVSICLQELHGGNQRQLHPGHCLQPPMGLSRVAAFQAALTGCFVPWHKRSSFADFSSQGQESEDEAVSFSLPAYSISPKPPRWNCLAFCSRGWTKATQGLQAGLQLAVHLCRVCAHFSCHHKTVEGLQRFLPTQDVQRLSTVSATRPQQLLLQLAASGSRQRE